jgi:arsenate reductase
MAEGWVNAELGGTWEAYSAGIRPAARVHPLAVKAMHEVGVDLSHARPEHVDAYRDDRWDLVITVCDSAREACPVLPSPAEQLHISFFDPADAVGSEGERLAVFRKVRDAIRERLVPEVSRRTGVSVRPGEAASGGAV